MSLNKPSYNMLGQDLHDKIGDLSQTNYTDIASGLKDHTSKLADIAYNVLFPPPPLVAPKADGTTDFGSMLNGISSSKYYFPQGTYLFTTGWTIANDHTDVIFHPLAKIHVIGGITPITITGNYCRIFGGEIYSDGITSNNGVYGIYVSGSYTLIKNTYIHDITDTAIMNAGTYNNFYDIIARNVGWDLASNNGNSSFGKWMNCKAYLTGRHGFSTDAGSSYVEFINCYSEDTGASLTLGQGQDSYHFESSNYGKISNCTARFTSNHPAVTQATTGQMHGLRNESSQGIIIDGFTLVFDSGFVPITSNDFAWVYNNHTETDFVENVMKITNSKFINNSSIVSKAYLGPGKIEISGSEFIGKFTTNQASGSGLISKLDLVRVYGDPSTIFLNFAHILTTIITKCHFENVSAAVSGRIVNSLIKDSRFYNSTNGIQFGQDTSNSASKSINNVVQDNTFDTLTTAITLGWQGAVGEITRNIFKGTIGTVLNGTSGGQTANWHNNIADSSLSYTTLTGTGQTAFTIDSSLRSPSEKTVQVPLYAGGTGAYLWVDTNGELRIKSTLPTSATDGLTVGSQT